MPHTLSICIPCYRSERYIRTTIESALAQSHSALEVLVSDDNSPDHSYEIIREYEGVRGVKVLRPPHRLGLGQHYRFLLEQAQGDFVCFLSSDDALMPSFLGTMRDALTHNPQVGLIAAACVECDMSLVPKGVWGLALPRRVLNAPNGYRHFAKSCSYTISTAIFSRQMLLETEPLPDYASIPTDWYWALLIGLRAPIKFLRRPLGYYRLHDSNASHSGSERWRREANAMLRFIIQTVVLEPDLRGELENQIRRLELGAKEIPKNWKLRIKGYVKSRLARRYLPLPSFLAMAERGVSKSLQ